MLETIKHLVGFCGESHINVLYLLYGSTALPVIVNYIRVKYFNKQIK